MSRCAGRSICGFLDALTVCLIATMVLFNFGLLPVPGLETAALAARYPCYAPSGAGVGCPPNCLTILGNCTVTPPLPATGLTTTCVLAFGVCGPGTFGCPGTVPFGNPPVPRGCNCTVSGNW